MVSNDPYEGIVELYDLEHESFTDDVELYLELAARSGGPILETGSGTGRILLPLAEAGFAVVGVDSSDPMHQAARLRASGRADITLVNADMENLAEIPGGPFGMVISSLNSIMHLTDPMDQRDMIATAYAALAPGGSLVIDTLNPSVAQLNHLLGTTHLEGSWHTEDGTTIDKWGHREAGPESQILDTLIWYDQVDAEGSYHRTRTQFALRYVHQSELALLLELAGFAHVDWYGSYELDPWDPAADRIIAIAYKDQE